MKINDIITESHDNCPHCSGPLVEYSELTEKKDACYYKVKASAKVWPSAYASGRLVQCRKKGAGNYGKKSESVEESTDKKCPPATQDITLNLKHRQKAINEYGYGPLNPDMPNTKFWMKKVNEWNLDSPEEAKQSLCGNCAAFDQRADTLDCIAQGIGSDQGSDDPSIKAGDLGYCRFLKFKCASRRTCDAWVTGGPLSDDKDGVSNESIELSLDEQFDIIEEMVEHLAETHGVNSEIIWEDFESVDDTELYETAAWQRSSGKNKNGGLNKKGVTSYRREHPGSKLQTAVTTKPSKLKPGSKAAKRRKSFCARMGGMKGAMKKPNGKPTRKALALRKWNC